MSARDYSNYQARFQLESDNQDSSSLSLMSRSSPFVTDQLCMRVNVSS